MYKWTAQDQDTFEIESKKITDKYLANGLTKEQFELADLNHQDLCTRWEQGENWGQPTDLDCKAMLELWGVCLDSEVC